LPGSWRGAFASTSSRKSKILRPPGNRWVGSAGPRTLRATQRRQKRSPAGSHDRIRTVARNLLQVHPETVSERPVLGFPSRGYSPTGSKRILILACSKTTTDPFAKTSWIRSRFASKGVNYRAGLLSACRRNKITEEPLARGFLFYPFHLKDDLGKWLSPRRHPSHGQCGP
jgi:hypothetical protein